MKEKEEVCHLWEKSSNSLIFVFHDWNHKLPRLKCLQVEHTERERDVKCKIRTLE